MSNRHYGLVLVMALIVGLLGGALSGPIAESLLPQKLLPKYLRARRGFEIIDKRGKLSVRLDKEGLAFFDENGEQSTLLNQQGVSFTFANEGLYSRVQLSPTNPCIISFTQNPPYESGAVLLGPGGLQPEEVPKLGCGIKDGKVLWTVP